MNIIPKCQGIRVYNVNTLSSANKTGLDLSDIILDRLLKYKKKKIIIIKK